MAKKDDLATFCVDRGTLLCNFNETGEKSRFAKPQFVEFVVAAFSRNPPPAKRKRAAARVAAEFQPLDFGAKDTPVAPFTEAIFWEILAGMEVDQGEYRLNVQTAAQKIKNIGPEESFAFIRMFQEKREETLVYFEELGVEISPKVAGIIIALGRETYDNVRESVANGDTFFIEDMKEQEGAMTNIDDLLKAVEA